MSIDVLVCAVKLVQHSHQVPVYFKAFLYLLHDTTFCSKTDGQQN